MLYVLEELPPLGETPSDRTHVEESWQKLFRSGPYPEDLALWFPAEAFPYISVAGLKNKTLPAITPEYFIDFQDQARRNAQAMAVAVREALLTETDPAHREQYSLLTLLYGLNMESVDLTVTYRLILFRLFDALGRNRPMLYAQLNFAEEQFGKFTLWVQAPFQTIKGEMPFSGIAGALLEDMGSRMFEIYCMVYDYRMRCIDQNLRNQFRYNSLTGGPMRCTLGGRADQL